MPTDGRALPTGLAWAATLVVLAALPGPAFATASRAELEQRVERLERLTDNQGLLELARQVDQLGEQVRSLRGALEELQHAVDEGKAQQRAQYLDLDKRLKAVEDTAARLSQGVQAAQPGAGGPPGQAAAPGAPAGQAAPGGPAAASDAAAGYQAAFDLLKAGKYDEARAGFQAFLKAHPSDDLAPNAQYWLGEVAYVGRDYAGALAAFRKVESDYKQARKAPDAALKAGYCLYELKRYPEARVALNEVTAKYPDSSAAKDAAARLAQMTAEGH